MLVVTSYLFLVLAACEPAAQAAVNEARERAAAFDLSAALDASRRAVGCDEGEGAAEYLEGLLAARAAATTGGLPEALQDVRSAANALARRAEGGARRWEVASLVMRAAAAASQDERDEMAVFLAEAIRIEEMLLAAGQPAAPLLTAHEVAGDLWLQVHRFDDARAAYVRAGERVGRTGAVRLGLARTAARLFEPTLACYEYRSLLQWWGEQPGIPAEIEEARTWLRTHACQP